MLRAAKRLGQYTLRCRHLRRSIDAEQLKILLLECLLVLLRRYFVQHLTRVAQARQLAVREVLRLLFVDVGRVSLLVWLLVDTNEFLRALPAVLLTLLCAARPLILTIMVLERKLAIYLG